MTLSGRQLLCVWTKAVGQGHAAGILPSAPGVHAPPQLGGFPAGEWRELDQVWIGRLVWLQLGYPIVSALEFAWVQAAARGWFKMTKVGADSYPAALSFAKDLFYGVLDVLTKGGLAMYASSRAAYL